MKTYHNLLTAVCYALFFIFIEVIVSVTFIAVSRLTGGGGQLTTAMTIVSMAAASVATIAAFCFFRWAQPTRQYMQSRPWGVLSWSVVAAFGTVLPSMWVQEQLPELPNLVEQQLADVMMHRGGYFVICLLGPLAEELVFRGAVLRTLLTWRADRPWLMIALSALLFALVHANPAQMPHAFIMGLLLGWMYQRTGSIAPGVAFHWANNTLAYIMFRMYPSPSIRLADMLGGDQRAVGAAIIFSLFILLPAIYQLHLNMRKTGTTHQAFNH